MTKQINDLLEEYGYLLSNLPDSLAIIDEKGKFLKISKKFCDLSGYSEKEIIGKNIFSLPMIDKKSVSLVKQNFKKRMEGEAVPLYKIDAANKKGEKIVVEINGKIIDYQGQKSDLLLLRIVLPLTNVKQNTNQKNNNAQNYLNIVDVMILALNSERAVMMINKKGCEVLEYEKKDIIGKNWFDNFVPQKDKDKTKIFFNELMAEKFKEFKDCENSIITSTGKEKTIFWHNSLLRDENGKIIGILSSGENITDRKNTEIKSKTKLERLEKLNKIMVGRELKMIELKKEIGILKNR